MVLSTNDIDLTIIIVNWNTRRLLLDCLASIENSASTSSREVIVVDNASTDGSVQAVAHAFPDVQVIVNAENQGFARANNAALKRMRGRYAVLLNSDTVLKESTLEGLYDFMERHPDAGMCGLQLLNADGSKQKSTGVFPTLTSEFLSRNIARFFAPNTSAAAAEQKEGGVPTAVDFILGACMMVRKKAIDGVGMLDEDYFFLYEEIDWCFRMHKGGWQVYHVPDVSLYHLGGQSMKEINLRARVESWQSRYLFFKKNLALSPLAWGMLLMIGSLHNLYHFLLYGLLNLATIFSIKRLRKRWVMFAYLLLWHARGRPVSMGIPR